MLGFDSIGEIVSTVKKNKLRTFLTGFAVAWGILMLIILLGAGNGLRNGILRNFDSDAANCITISSGYTSMPFKGMPVGRYVVIDHRTVDMLKEQFPEIEYISAAVGINSTITYKDNYIATTFNGTMPEATYINNLIVNEGDGRFLNYLDMKERRKVVVLPPQHARTLFGDEDPIGKYVFANNIAFQVIGVYDASLKYDNDPPCYIPLSTAEALNTIRWGYWWIDFTVNGLDTQAKNEHMEKRLREKLAAFHNFDSADRSAIYVWSNPEQYLQLNRIMTMVTLFLVIVGVACMMAGVVGVGNIMLVTVRERTREFGIRKSLGATSGSILRLVIFESIFITTVAGYVGILTGVAITEFFSLRMTESDMFVDPTVDISTVLLATLLLILCGIVAGMIPALKATRVSPVEAMRAD